MCRHHRPRLCQRRRRASTPAILCRDLVAAIADERHRCDHHRRGDPGVCPRTRPPARPQRRRCVGPCGLFLELLAATHHQPRHPARPDASPANARLEACDAVPRWLPQAPARPLLSRTRRSPSVGCTSFPTRPVMVSACSATADGPGRSKNTSPDTPSVWLVCLLAGRQCHTL